jgi:hypothetical protein
MNEKSARRKSLLHRGYIARQAAKVDEAISPAEVTRNFGRWIEHL